VLLGVLVVATDRIALATVAAEDERFYSHHGIDTLGALRALWGRITGVDLGGSTLDQQLAKNLYTVKIPGSAAASATPHSPSSGRATTPRRPS
jgi:membrane peptidoglycan carboxypeptidase